MSQSWLSEKVCRGNAEMFGEDFNILPGKIALSTENGGTELSCSREFSQVVGIHVGFFHEAPETLERGTKILEFVSLLSFVIFDQDKEYIENIAFFRTDIGVLRFFGQIESQGRGGFQIGIRADGFDTGKS